MSNPGVHQFLNEPIGRFALGQILPANLLTDIDELRREEKTASWQCDIQKNDKLTWSDEVYDLFGIRRGGPIDREEALGRYKEHSRRVLERVRGFAISHRYAFVLDAEISPGVDQSRWIRIFAAPFVEDNRVVELRGLKLSL